jgi:hypothetical protein
MTKTLDTSTRLTRQKAYLLTELLKTISLAGIKTYPDLTRAVEKQLEFRVSVYSVQEGLKLVGRALDVQTKIDSKDAVRYLALALTQLSENIGLELGPEVYELAGLRKKL